LRFPLRLQAVGEIGRGAFVGVSALADDADTRPERASWRKDNYRFGRRPPAGGTAAGRLIEIKAPGHPAT
jgi:hypothetical protein